MSRIKGLLGLPEFTLNALGVGVSGLIICLGIKIAIAPNLALQWANARIVTSSSAGKLEKLAQQLDEKAVIIKQKDEAYSQLKATYEEFLTNETGGIELDKAFNTIEGLPEVEDTREIQTEIELIEEDLSEIPID